MGLGGLYDATNIAEAKVVGITPISLEHTDKLGKTISKIAVQKCGVIKGREYVVSAPQPREAETVIAETVADREAKLMIVGKDIRISERDHGPDYQKLDIKMPAGNYFDLTLHLLGQHQLENAAQAVALAKGFEEKTRIKITETAIRQGIVDVRWPGRMEKIGDRPAIVIDGAHNRDSMRRLVLALGRHFHFAKLFVILGVSADKDLEGILEELLPETQKLYATQSAHPRSLDARKIADAVEALGGEVILEKNFDKAFTRDSAEATVDDLILVTGSLYLVAEAKKRVEGR